MSNDMTREMTAQRFAQLLDSYGADSARWPDAEREAALVFVDINADARAMLREVRQLDLWMQTSAPPVFAGLEARVLNQALPSGTRGVLDRLMAWLLPPPGLVMRQIWRPAVVACLPLAIGLLVGFQFEQVPEGHATSVEQELYLISLSDYAEIL